MLTLFPQKRFQTERKVEDLGTPTPFVDVAQFGKLVYDMSLEQSNRLQVAYQEEQARAQENEKAQLEEQGKMFEDDEKAKDRLKEEREMEKARRKHELRETKKKKNQKGPATGEEEIPDSGAPNQGEDDNDEMDDE